MSDSEKNISSSSKIEENNTKVNQDKKTNPDDKYPTKRGFTGYLCKNLGLFLASIFINMKALGKENFPKDNPYVVAANHQSYPDGLYIAKYLPRGHYKYMCCLAASDLETNHGWIGRVIMRVGRGIAVDRYGNPVRGLIKAKKEVEKGDICFVFPEGTRSATGKLCEFKDGACYLAIKANVPLVPVYITGAYQFWPRQSKWPQPFNGFLKRKKIRIVVGEPLYGKDFDNDAHKMTTHLSEWMHKMEDNYYDPEVLDKALFKRK